MLVQPRLVVRAHKRQQRHVVVTPRRTDDGVAPAFVAQPARARPRLRRAPLGERGRSASRRRKDAARAPRRAAAACAAARVIEAAKGAEAVAERVERLTIRLVRRRTARPERAATTAAAATRLARGSCAQSPRTAPSSPARPGVRASS